MAVKSAVQYSIGVFLLVLFSLVVLFLSLSEEGVYEAIVYDYLDGDANYLIIEKGLLYHRDYGQSNRRKVGHYEKDAMGNVILFYDLSEDFKIKVKPGVFGFEMLEDVDNEHYSISKEYKKRVFFPDW